MLLPFLPASDSTLYWGSTEGLYLSKLGSDAWTKADVPTAQITSIQIVNAVVYVASLKGLSFSRDQGETWHTFTAADGLGDDRVWDVTVDGNRIYAATDGGLSVLTAKTATP